MCTAGPVQLVQVKVAEASLVMEAGEEASDKSTLEAERSGSPVLVSEADGKYEVHSLTSKITKDMLDPGDVEALEIDDDLLVLSWCALGVPLDGLHLAMIWCALVLDVMYEDPSPAQRIHKDLLDPGGFVTTDGLVQEVQVMLAKVYLVMESSKEDVIFHIGSTATWCDLLGALVKFASLGPRSVWTNQCVLKYACGSRLRLVCYLVCTSFLLGMCSGKSQGAQLMRQPSLMYCLEHGGNVALDGLVGLW